MNQPQWIEDKSVLVIHDAQLLLHGGIAGIRDAGLLSSALHRPLNLWNYASTSADLPTLAAAYAVGISRNHPFLDGYKRTAAVVCETYLVLNGLALVAEDDEWYDTMIAVAAGEMSEEDLARWIRERVASL